MRQLLEHRNAALQRAADPLPGSRPYDNFRPISIPARLDGRTLLESVCAMHPQLDPRDWDHWFRSGHILCDGQPARPGRSVRGGERYWHWFPETIEPDVNPDVRVIWEDPDLVAVSKPAPLPVHPCGRLCRNTLTGLLDSVYGAGQLRLTHRLDANTTGVLLLARSRHAASELRKQFETSQIEKRYTVRVIGHPPHDRFTCEVPIGRGRSAAGTRTVDPTGLDAVTLFHTVKRFDDGTSLLEAIPRTGRTNQIRIHLWSMRLAVMGDPSYLPNRRLASTQTLSTFDPPMCLHAWSVEFPHPTSGEGMCLTAAPPPWAKGQP